MDSIVAIILILASTVAAIASNLVASELYDRAPALARALIRFAAKRVRKVSSGRYEEEWLAHLHEREGKLGQLVHALGCVYASLRMGRLESPHPWQRKALFRLLATHDIELRSPERRA